MIWNEFRTKKIYYFKIIVDYLKAISDHFEYFRLVGYWFVGQIKSIFLLLLAFTLTRQANCLGISYMYDN